MMSESEERDIGGGPLRPIIVITMRWTRPPHPRFAIEEPASVMIRCPSPRFVRDPRPSPIRLPYPASGAIRSPVRGDGRRPDQAVVLHVEPVAVGIEVLTSHVVAVSVVPGLSVANGCVAIVVPGIPSVICRRPAEHIARIVGGATHGHGLAERRARASVRRRNVGCSGAHNHLRLKATHLYAVNTFLGCGADGRIRRVDLDRTAGLLGDGVVCEPLSDLDLDLRSLCGCNLRQRIISETKDVRMVELQFGLRTVSGGAPVARDQRLVQRCGRPVTWRAFNESQFSFRATLAVAWEAQLL